MATLSDRIPILERIFRHAPRSFISLNIGELAPLMSVKPLEIAPPNTEKAARAAFSVRKAQFA
jgi:hypothetical protein